MILNSVVSKRLECSRMNCRETLLALQIKAQHVLENLESHPPPPELLENLFSSSFYSTQTHLSTYFFFVFFLKKTSPLVAPIRISNSFCSHEFVNAPLHLFLDLFSFIPLRSISIMFSFVFVLSV